ncbi:MAG: DUF1801 domain-containing protein [Candidatus Micrarchaeaceae archaeon]|jgi:hypothetical protein
MNKRQTEYKREIRKKISGRFIDTRVQKLGDWRGDMLSRIRVLMKQIDPKIIEEVKWIKPSNPLGTATWSQNGLICTWEAYKNHVRMTFAKGASLDDSSHIFNSGLEGNVMRAIVFHEEDKINERVLKNLISSAIALNTAALKKKPSKK